MRDTEPGYRKKVIAVLFERLSKMHGNLWDNKWEGHDMADVMESWEMELSAQPADAIAWALERWKEDPSDYPPSLNHFNALCNCAPAQNKLSNEAPVSLLVKQSDRDSPTARKYKARIRKLLSEC